MSKLFSFREEFYKYLGMKITFEWEIESWLQIRGFIVQKRVTRIFTKDANSTWSRLCFDRLTTSMTLTRGLSFAAWVDCRRARLAVKSTEVAKSVAVELDSSPQAESAGG